MTSSTIDGIRGDNADAQHSTLARHFPRDAAVNHLDGCAARQASPPLNICSPTATPELAAFRRPSPWPLMDGGPLPHGRLA